MDKHDSIPLKEKTDLAWKHLGPITQREFNRCSSNKTVKPFKEAKRNQSLAENYQAGLWRPDTPSLQFIMAPSCQSLVHLSNGISRCQPLSHTTALTQWKVQIYFPLSPLVLSLAHKL